jgi:hypothetical protein
VTGDSIDPIAVALAVVRTLDSLGVPSTIGGSIASSFAGEPRSTIDIDIVAAIEGRHIPALIHALSPDFYVDAGALRRAVSSRGSVNLIHQATMLKVDIFVAGGTPLDRQQLARRRPVEVRPGEVLFVHPPEDILLQKLRWYRLGGEVSDRQWRDVLGIVRVQAGRLDVDYLRTHAPSIDVADLLDRVLTSGDAAGR